MKRSVSRSLSLLSVILTIVTVFVLAGCINLIQESRNTKNEYALSFNANGGSGSMATVKMAES